MLELLQAYALAVGSQDLLYMHLQILDAVCSSQPGPGSEHCGRMYDHGPGGLSTSSKHRVPDTIRRWQFRIDLGTRTEPIIDGVRVSIGQASDDSTVVASQQSELQRAHQS
jgi:hypothetical protein